jgi:hypothetical protein
LDYSIREKGKLSGKEWKLEAEKWEMGKEMGAKGGREEKRRRRGRGS